MKLFHPLNRISGAGWVLAGAFFLILMLAACTDGDRETAVTTVPPTPTTIVESTPESSSRNFIVVATDAPNPPYTEFDQFGNVSGFIQRIMAEIATSAGLEYEFVVTPHEGVLQSLAADDNDDFDAVVSNLLIPEEPQPGIAYTDPFLEIGQVMVVLVDEERIQSPQDVQSEMAVGVAEGSYGEQTAREVLGVSNSQLVNQYDNSVSALQALINEEVTAVVVDSYTGQYYADTYPDRLKVVGGSGRTAWISSRAYGIAVAADNQPLLEQLNTAIEDIRSKGALSRITVELLPDQQLQPGESRAGTAANELVIGILGQLNDMDPASLPELISWEAKINTMSGLYRLDGNNEIVPLLATGMPTISEDKLEYTISLRQGLRFSDGSELTAEDVKWSIDRARSMGNFLVNSILKDANDDGFADDDAVQVIDQYTVKFVLQAPTGYFLSLLTTPTYFPISSECYTLTQDLQSDCGGIGPYTIVSWQPGEQMRLQANPEWPGRPVPAFENIVLRFFDNAQSMRSALEEFQSIDVAWTGFPFDLVTTLADADANADGTADFVVWEGPAAFKSYLIFNHEEAPWDRAKIRRAAAAALDREALATLFNGQRQPLFSPVPDAVPGHTPALSTRNIGQARTLLLEEGYSEGNPLEIELWYVNDGRYSSIEETYATAIKEQLEETNVFQVTLNGANFDLFRANIGECGYPLYLLGWPTPGNPVNYPDVMSWTDFFITNTGSGFCSNYESSEMDELRQEALETTETAARLAVYEQMQQLWSEELPTLDLLQEPRFAVSLPNVSNVKIDALGLLHYELLTKGGN